MYKANAFDCMQQLFKLLKRLNRLFPPSCTKEVFHASQLVNIKLVSIQINYQLCFSIICDASPTFSRSIRTLDRKVNLKEHAFLIKVNLYVLHNNNIKNNINNNNINKNNIINNNNCDL
jgi:hypothetical protein